MTWNPGEKIVCPGRGPCLVDGIIRKVVCGVSTRFYKLALLDGSKAELLVPVEKLRDLQIRALLDRTEIPALLRHLTTGTEARKERRTAKNWRERQLANSKVLSSGSLFDIADAVESLTQLGDTKTLAADERATLYRARKLMACEIAEVMNESEGAAQARIDTALMRETVKDNARMKD